MLFKDCFLSSIALEFHFDFIILYGKNSSLKILCTSRPFGINILINLKRFRGDFVCLQK